MTTEATATQAPQNSVSSRYLRHMTDDEIREGVASVKEKFLNRAFPGKTIEADSIADALAQGGADFFIEKAPIFQGVAVAEDGSVQAREILSHVCTRRADTGETLGVVGKDYGVVQYHQAFEALDILAKRGEVELKKVDVLAGGAKVRVTALLGETTFLQADGKPNTLGHFAHFEASADGNSSITASLYTLRLECFNGMTSREVAKVHKIAHRKHASDRMEEATVEILESLIEDAQAEVEIFRAMAASPLSRDEFEKAAHEILGGELAEDASTRARNARQKEIDELLGYWDGGNQGAGETAFGGFNSFTRWLESKREAFEDATKAAKRFESNLSGHGQRQLQKALTRFRG